MKNLILSAFLMGAATVSFAGNPKEEAKEATTKTETQAQLYWYRVTYSDPTDPTSGQIMSSTDLFAHSEKSQVNSPCDQGNDLDCLRGYSTQLSSFPNSTTATDVIEKPAE